VAGTVDFPLVTINPCITDDDCPNGGMCDQASFTCIAVAVESPEMSDVLALAFLVIAGGIVFVVRRRAIRLASENA
jgi:hypothetical protein